LPFLTSGDDSDRVQVASVKPQKRTIDVFHFNLGQRCPSNHTINLSSYQGGPCMNVSSFDTDTGWE